MSSPLELHSHDQWPIKHGIHLNTEEHYNSPFRTFTVLKTQDIFFLMWRLGYRWCCVGIGYRKYSMILPALTLYGSGLKDLDVRFFFLLSLQGHVWLELLRCSPPPPRIAKILCVCVCLCVFLIRATTTKSNHSSFQKHLIFIFCSCLAFWRISKAD